jgi:aminoglycoside 2''-phosphotransferase
MPEIEPYLRSIQHVYPDLPIVSARFDEAGQNNVVLILNEKFIFRFPRYLSALKQLEIELAVLTGIQDYITLRIPRPLFTRLDAPAGGQAFMGYQMIPGAQFWRETLAAIQAEPVLDRLADQLAGFLKELHCVPVREAIACELPLADTADECADIYQRMQARCFPHMRPDAREWAAQHFERFLSAQRHFDYQPVLKHSDFGMGNILFDATSQTITGIIDFGSVALGDPAYDFAGLLSSYGETFLHRLERGYPELASYWERIHFYRGTFALLEALFGLEQGDEEAFRHGISDFI